MFVTHQTHSLRIIVSSFIEKSRVAEHRFTSPHRLPSFFPRCCVRQESRFNHSASLKLPRKNGRTPAQKEKGKEKRRERRRAPYATPSAHQEHVQPPVKRKVILVEPKQPYIGPLEADICERRQNVRDEVVVETERNVISHSNDHPSPNTEQVDPEILVIDEVEFDFE